MRFWSLLCKRAQHKFVIIIIIIIINTNIKVIIT